MNTPHALGRSSASAPTRPLPSRRMPRGPSVRLVSPSRRRSLALREPRSAWSGPFRPSRLDDRTVLVAGGAAPTQRSIAEAVLREGGRIAILSESSDRIEALPADDCIALRGRVRDPDAVGDAVRRTIERFGGLDVVVVDASADACAAAPSADAVAACFDSVRAAAAFLDPGASVIATLARGTYEDVARLIEETRAWALALRQRAIRVNGIAPRLRAIEAEGATRLVPSAVGPRARELARCCVFLASDESIDLTGHVFPAA